MLVHRQSLMLNNKKCVIIGCDFIFFDFLNVMLSLGWTVIGDVDIYDAVLSIGSDIEVNTECNCVMHIDTSSYDEVNEKFLLWLDGV